MADSAVPAYHKFALLSSWSLELIEFMVNHPDNPVIHYISHCNNV